MSNHTKQDIPYQDWRQRVVDWVHHYACLPLEKFTAKEADLRALYDEGKQAGDAAIEIINLGGGKCA